MEEKQKSKKSLLVVSQHFWPENFRISDIVEGFVADDIEVDVLCGLPNYPKGEWFSGYSYKGPRSETYKGARLFRCGEVPRKGNTSVRIFLNYCSFPVLALGNLHRLKRKRYDAVLCYETSPVMMLLPAIVYAKTHNIPLVGYVLDLWPDNLYSVLAVKSEFWRSVAYNVSAFFYKKCERLIALSETQAGLLAKMTQKSKSSPEISIIPQYSEDFYADKMPMPKEAEGFKDGFNILFAGNISPAQDLENLVRAMALVKKVRSDIRVIILGDGMSKDALKQCIKDEGVEDLFVFCGSVAATEVPGWTGFADVLFAALSASENLAMTVPAKIASYMAAEKPLLVATGGEGEVAAKESGAALVSEPGVSKQLCDNIIKLAEMSEKERKDMGKAGFRYYEEHYKRDALLLKLRKVIFDEK